MSSTTAFLATNDGALVYELEDADTTIGRAETNDIVLTNSRSISGNHCRVSVRAGRARLTDLGSMNGTFLNDARLQNSCVRRRTVATATGPARQTQNARACIPPSTHTLPTLSNSSLSLRTLPSDLPRSCRATLCALGTTPRFTVSTTRATRRRTSSARHPPHRARAARPFPLTAACGVRENPQTGAMRARARDDHRCGAGRSAAALRRLLHVHPNYCHPRARRQRWAVVAAVGGARSTRARDSRFGGGMLWWRASPLPTRRCAAAARNGRSVVQAGEWAVRPRSAAAAAVQPCA